MEMQNGTRQLGGEWRGGREVEIGRWRQTAVWALGMRQRGGAGQAGAEALAGTGDAATGRM